jgi:hypothetical protein
MAAKAPTRAKRELALIPERLAKPPEERMDFPARAAAGRLDAAAERRSPGGKTVT